MLFICIILYYKHFFLKLCWVFFHNQKSQHLLYFVTILYFVMAHGYLALPQTADLLGWSETPAGILS